MSLRERAAAVFAALRRREGIVLGFLLCLLVVSRLGVVDAAIDGLGRGEVRRANGRFLEKSGKETAETLLILTALKSELATLDTSSVGLSFVVHVNVEVGKFLSPAVEVVDRGWNAAIWAAGAWTSIGLVLEIADWGATPALNVFLLALTLYCGWAAASGRWNRRAGRLVLILGSLAFALHVAVPLSVYAGAKLSDRFTSGSKEKARAGLGEIRDAAPSSPQRKGLEGMARGVPERFMEWRRAHHERTHQLVHHVLLLSISWLFDLLIFPGAVFLLTVALTHALLGALLVRGEEFFVAVRTHDADMEAGVRPIAPQSPLGQ